MAAAGLASATAALVTSRFGVAGTLIGAALTTMIITGGSAILRSYLESVTGRVRQMPGKVRQKAGKRNNRQADEPRNIPERPDLRNNFMGRLRASFDWFRRLSPLRRRTIVVGAIVPAVIAFLISMGAVTALEVAIGNSLPCALWKNCPVATDGSGATSVSTRPSLFGGGAGTGASSQDQQIPDSQQQTPGQQDAQPDAADPDSQPGSDPSVQPVDPQQPAVPDSGTPDSGTPDSGQPVEPAPVDPSSPPAQETPAPSE